MGRPRWQTGVVAGGVVLSLLFCGGLLVYGSGRGFDLTDETFYLIWARDPNAYALIYQPFGYLLHPLFRAVGGDLQSYRLSGFAIAAGAGAVLGASLAITRPQRSLFALQGAACALTIFFPWIVTPSYNSAANVGAMLILAGLVLARGPRPALAAMLGGTGLCLAAFAKPPLFAIALAAMLATAALSKRRSRRWALVAAPLIGLALMSLLLPPTDLVGLVRRMAATQRILALPNTPLHLPAKIVRDAAIVPPLLLAAAAAAAATVDLRATRWFAWSGAAAVVLSAGYIASVAGDAIDGEIPDFIGLALLLIAIAYAGGLQGRRPLATFDTVALLAAPFAVALGTFNNHWAQLNFSMAFPLLAIFAFGWADPVGWRRAAALAFALVAPAVILLTAAFAPYSLPAPIRDQQIAIEEPVTHSRVLVDAETADFVRAARGRARGAPLIDLSGTGPGVATVLGGRPPALAWLNPATPTWPDVAWARLGAADRATAWFVGPVWPPFERTAPARWLAERSPTYCREELPEMPFWGVERTLIVWHPCRHPTIVSPGDRARH